MAWTNTPIKQGGIGKITYSLIADKNHSIGKDYGVMVKDSGIAYRGLFIIDSKQIIRQIIINDLKVVRSVDENVRLVKALQFTDEHGEVCPVGWDKKDDDTNVPEVEKSKAF